MSARKAAKKTTKAAVKPAAKKAATKKAAKTAVVKKVAKKTTDRAAPAAGADVLARVRGAQQAVTIGKAGGRPMLSWVGKRAPASVQAFPAQLVETYGEQASDGALWERWPDGLRRGGLLYHGDNKEVLAHLLANGFRGQVKLIYIDPPFDSGADYVRKVELRGPKGKAKLDGEGYTLGEQIQYTDIWANDNYLQFMYERLLLLKELLSEDGALYLHCDQARGHYLKLVADEVFGSSQFRSEVIWKRTTGHSDARHYGVMHDTILFYTKSGSHKLNDVRQKFDDDYVEAYYRYKDDDGRRFMSGDLTGAGSGPARRFGGKGLIDPPAGRHWMYDQRGIDRVLKEKRVYWTKNGVPRLKIYLDEQDGMAAGDLWADVQAIRSWHKEAVGYPTQKPENLLARIVCASTSSGDIVLDAFIGSGTTTAVAQKLGRRWIGCDINKGAIQTTAKRLQRIMEEQVGEEGRPEQGMLLGDGDAPSPAQLGFTHWRVNDYDLAIQHNEAVNLACEYLGVERLRNDPYFDGLLGKRLVKIIPFGHPLSPMDLEAIKNELDARPDEDRAITVVCLGKELASDTWLTEWNRLRKKKTDPHHIEVIELRNDPKYGGFIQHEHAQARVAVKRKGANLHVEIKDFVSPGILQRLAQQSGVVQAKVADWRAMVDSVMIDTAYDGAVFNVTLADVPARKTDFVAGDYVLDAPAGDTTVAVKITDMLGEELLLPTVV